MVTPIFRLGYLPHTFDLPALTRRAGSEDRIRSMRSRVAAGSRSRSYHNVSSASLSMADFPPSLRVHAISGAHGRLLEHERRASFHWRGFRDRRFLSALT